MCAMGHAGPHDPAGTRRRTAAPDDCRTPGRRPCSGARPARRPRRTLPAVGSGPAPGPPPAPAVLILPAMGTPARFYRRFARHLHGEGLAVLTPTCAARARRHRAPPAAARVTTATACAITAIACAITATARTTTATARSSRRTCPPSSGPSAPSWAPSRPCTSSATAWAANSPCCTRRWVPVRPSTASRSSPPAPSGSARTARCAPPGLLLGQVLIAATATALGRWPGARLAFGATSPRASCGTGPTRGSPAATPPRAPRATTKRPWPPWSCPSSRSPSSTTPSPPPPPSTTCSARSPGPASPGATTRAEVGARLDHFAWTRASGPLAKQVAAWATAEGRPERGRAARG